MHFHGATRSLKGSPRTQRKTDIHGGGIQSVDGIVEFDPERLMGVERASDADQNLSQIGIHAPVAVLVGIGQGGSRYLAAYPEVIELTGDRA